MLMTLVDSFVTAILLRYS